jgi:hypothetical protein
MLGSLTELLRFERDSGATRSPGVAKVKVEVDLAEDGFMGPHPVAATETKRRRNVRDVTGRIVACERRFVAVVIESLDQTCTVVGSDFALSCGSLCEAMQAVDEVAPRVFWRETNPGFWVARSIEQ